MDGKRDVIPLFNWARQNGEAKVIDRILVKLMPEFIRHNCQITAEDISQKERLDVPSSLYINIKKSAEDIIGTAFTEKGDL